MVHPAFGAEELAFARQVDEVVRASMPAPMQFYGGRGGAARELYRALGERGWLSLTWPAEHGGRGLPLTYDYLLWDTLAYLRAGRPDLGPGIIAHIVIEHGTDLQREWLLPQIASGEACVALGYSEPEAGSDLAALRCRAARVDGGYRVSGEKCWTSDAHHATYLWLLCRTGEIEERGRGLTLLLVDLAAPGVTIAPIETIDGHRLNQVFLDEVLVPSERRFGAEGAAWSIIREALAVERHLQLLPGRVRRDFEDLCELLRRTGRADDAAARQRVGQLGAALQQVEASSLATVAALGAGRSGVEEAARTKLLGTRLVQEIPRAALDLVESAALDAADPLAFLWGQSFMETIAGGSTEVMLSILARTTLGLGSRG